MQLSNRSIFLFAEGENGKITYEIIDKTPVGNDYPEEIQKILGENPGATITVIETPQGPKYEVHLPEPPQPSEYPQYVITYLQEHPNSEVTIIRKYNLNC